MPKFDATRAVDPLEYDFTKYVAGCKGFIPEPSDDLLAMFSKRTAEFAQRFSPDTQGSMRKTLEVAARMTVQEYDEAARETATAYGELCQDQPSADDLLKLPPRLRAAFYGWVQEHLNPEG